MANVHNQDAWSVFCGNATPMYCFNYFLVFLQKVHSILMLGRNFQYLKIVSVDLFLCLTLIIGFDIATSKCSSVWMGSAHPLLILQASMNQCHRCKTHETTTSPPNGNSSFIYWLQFQSNVKIKSPLKTAVFLCKVIDLIIWITSNHKPGMTAEI